MRKIRIKIGDMFFYIGMLLQLFYTGRIITINSYENSSIYVVLILICFSIAIIKSKFTRKEINILVCLILISLCHMVAVGDTNLLRLCMMCYAGRRVAPDSLKKYFFASYVGLFALVYYLSSHGLIDSGMFQEGVWRVTKGWETRVTLGFDGATRMMFIWICIIASCQLLFGAKMLVRDAIFLYISMYLFKISVSYTGIIVSVAAIAAPYIFTFCVKMFGEDCVKLILRGSLITVLVLTLAATVMDLSNTALGIFLYRPYESLRKMVIGTKGKKWLTVLHVVLAAWLIYICIAGIDGLYIAQTADGGRVNSEMYVDLVVAVTMAFAVANQDYLTSKVFNKRIFGKLGEFSLYFFIVHIHCINIVCGLVGAENVTTSGQYYLCLLAVIALSAVLGVIMQLICKKGITPLLHKLDDSIQTCIKRGQEKAAV